MRRNPALLIGAFAFLLILPALAIGPMPTDSEIYNQRWLPEFSEQLADGVWYPRWLHQSWQGFGSPTFYFYPPVYFFLASTVRALSGNLLTTAGAAASAQGILLLLSGLGMRRWLAPAGTARATVGALAYMAAPYHLSEFYLRGALAESCCYALLPALALSLRRLGDGDNRAIPPLAVSYAVLLMAHPPTALLTSFVFLPCYALFVWMQKTHFALSFPLKAAAGLALGGLAAAIYLLPIVALMPQTLTSAMWSGFFMPRPWFFWTPATWPSVGRMRFIILLTGALTLLGASALAGGSGRRSIEACFWAGVTGLCLILIGGFVPPIWDIPIVAKVQFPWRLLPVMEFAAISAVALAPSPHRAMLLAGAGAAGLAFLLAGWITAKQLRDADFRAMLAVARADTWDGPEYLPAGYPLQVSDNLSTSPGSIVPPRRRAPWAAQGEVRQLPQGRARLITVTAAAPTIIVMPAYYFPAWRVVSPDGAAAAPTFPCTRDRLLCFRAPAGETRWRVSIAMLPIEKIALAVSAGALAVVIGLFFFLGRRSADAQRRPAAETRP